MESPPRLEGRVAFVTGAGAGIGAAVARRLSAEGAAVGVADIDAEAAGSVATEIEASGGCAVGVGTDVADRDSVRAALRATTDLGQLAIVANVAGITRTAMFANLDEERFREVLDVHLLGTYICCQEALSSLPEDGSGRIVNTTSAAGLIGTIGQANYAAAKAGIVGLTKAMARELGRRWITSNAVSPMAATEMTRTVRTDPRFAEKQLDRMTLRRWPEPEEVAGTYAFLASDDAACITGQVLCVDCGTVI